MYIINQFHVNFWNPLDSLIESTYNNSVMKVISSFQTHEEIHNRYISGLQNICDDIHFMVSTKVGIYWRITWGIVTPGVLIIIFVYFLATLTRITYGNFEYPDHVLGKLKICYFNSLHVKNICSFASNCFANLKYYQTMLSKQFF